MPEPIKFEVIGGDGLEALQGDCQDVVDFAKREFNVNLSFDDASIGWLSRFIEEHRAGMDAETRHNYSVKIAIFLGCAIIHHHGGEWVESEGNNLAVRFPSGAMTFPYTKTSKQFENGIVDNIYGLYRNMDWFLKPKKELPKFSHTVLELNWIKWFW